MDHLPSEAMAAACGFSKDNIKSKLDDDLSKIDKRIDQIDCQLSKISSLENERAALIDSKKMIEAVAIESISQIEMLEGIFTKVKLVLDSSECCDDALVAIIPELKNTSLGLLLSVAQKRELTKDLNDRSFCCSKHESEFRRRYPRYFEKDEVNKNNDKVENGVKKSNRRSPHFGSRYALHPPISYPNDLLDKPIKLNIDLSGLSVIESRFFKMMLGDAFLRLENNKILKARYS